MKLKTLSTFLRYGVSTVLAKKASNAGLTTSKTRALSQKDMVLKYGLSAGEAKALALAVRRAAIDSDVAQLLLERSNFVCCVCKPLQRLAEQGMNVDWYDYWLNGRKDPDAGKSAQYSRWDALKALPRCGSDVADSTKKP